MAAGQSLSRLGCAESDFPPAGGGDAAAGLGPWLQKSGPNAKAMTFRLARYGGWQCSDDEKEREFRRGIAVRPGVGQKAATLRLLGAAPRTMISLVRLSMTGFGTQRLFVVARLNVRFSQQSTFCICPRLHRTINPVWSPASQYADSGGSGIAPLASSGQQIDAGGRDPPAEPPAVQARETGPAWLSASPSASIRERKSTGSAPARSAKRHSASSCRFFTPSTTVSTPFMSSA